MWASQLGFPHFHPSCSFPLFPTWSGSIRAVPPVSPWELWEQPRRIPSGGCLMASVGIKFMQVSKY